MPSRPLTLPPALIPAFLAGTKRQHRIPVKPRKLAIIRAPYAPGDEIWLREKWASPEADRTRSGRVAYDVDGVCGSWFGSGEDRGFLCHGRVIQASGTHAHWPKEGATSRSLGDYTDIRRGEYPSYRYGWRSANTQPRWASRASRILTAVRCQRVQEITEEEADAEGTDTPEVARIIQVAWSKRDAFAKYWEHVHGPGAWARNEFVWVLEWA